MFCPCLSNRMYPHDVLIRIDKIDLQEKKEGKWMKLKNLVAQVSGAGHENARAIVTHLAKEGLRVAERRAHASWGKT